ncbi:hypothetical protein LOC68_13020 [Blastopirellula sp. JC732]|uniref:Secreted protein n=1 Tax=Blastopirellula sediminis TaxID=2894196 RepID=A0A9X1MME6_9BACT|nr:hypothetical protein [Blastopirellula sediminis]MCC9607388.1 hypothetical protein [Blastopirellula sediminis]MCC9629319.1 hypothetical protein [Blastopirellula sediminis]
MFRFVVTLLVMLGLALGSTNSLVSAAPLCAAPGETTCSCGHSTAASCCSTSVRSCCGVVERSCCQQTTEENLAGPTCDGCSCCVEPAEMPLAPASASEVHLPVDLFAWTSPVALDPASRTLPTNDRDAGLLDGGVSLQVLHCRWRN